MLEPEVEDLASPPSGSPAVSVTMPVYNGERFVRDAVESVLSDPFQDLELVVVDDGSTDGTPRILRECAAADSRVRVYREPGGTVAQALNRAAAHCKAPFLARLDADDITIPGRFEAQLEFLEGDPRSVLVGGQAELIDERGVTFGIAEYPTDDAQLREALRTANPFVHSATMMRRSAFDAIGGYRSDLAHSEDLDLCLRLAEHGALANLPRPVVKYRIHAAQQSLRKQRDQAVHAVATRMAARARAAGEPDPLEGASEIDEDFLLAHGVDRGEISRGIVTAACWLGRTSGRAGYPAAERALFEAAYETARSRAGSRALVAAVHRAASLRHAEQGHPLRARLMAARAALAERRLTQRLAQSPDGDTPTDPAGGLKLGSRSASPR
jgi:GT2 family glycosyltransferase